MNMPGGYPPPPHPPAKSRTALIVSVIAGLTVLLVAVAVALLVTRTNDSPAAAESSSTTTAVFTTADSPQSTQVVGGQSQESPPSTPSPTSSSPAATSSQSNPADLGLSQPISVPACDNSLVVIVANSTDPALYRTEMSAALAQRSRTGDNIQYMQAEQVGCSSIRSRIDGNLIYTAYVIAPSNADACRILAKYPGQYAKRLSNQDGPNDWVNC